MEMVHYLELSLRYLISGESIKAGFSHYLSESDGRRVFEIRAQEYASEPI